MTTEDQQATRDEAKDILNAARDSIRELSETANLVKALEVLSGLPESARKDANDLSTLIATLFEDLDQRLRKLRAEVLPPNTKSKVVFTPKDEQRSD